MRVAVLGASPNPQRYSNKAIRKLVSKGHEVIPVNPGHSSIEGLQTISSLAELTQPVDTITVYVGPAHIGPLVPQIVAAHPRRVILNPGAESDELMDALKVAGIPCLEACTLVMLATMEF